MSEKHPVLELTALHRLILKYLLEHGPATADTVAFALNIDVGNVHPRLSELMHDFDLIEFVPERYGRGRQGGYAKLYRIKVPGPPQPKQVELL